MEAERVAKEQADAAAAAEAERVAKEQADAAAAEAERVAKEQADAAAAASAATVYTYSASTPEQVEAERVAKEERLQYWKTYLEEQKVAVAAQEEADRVAKEQAGAAAAQVESERVSKERAASETTAKEDRLKYWKKFLEEQSAKPAPRPVAIQQVAAPVQAPASSVQRPKSRFLRNAVVPSFKHIGGI